MAINIWTTDELTTLHPALDILRNIATVGFRQKVVKGGKCLEEDVHFVRQDNGVRIEISYCRYTSPRVKQLRIGYRTDMVLQGKSYSHYMMVF